MRRIKYFEVSGRKQKEDDDGYSDESFEGDTFIDRKKLMLVVPRSAVTRNSTLMTTWQATVIDSDLGGESADDLARMDIAAHIRDNASLGCKCKNNQWTLLLPQLAQVDNLSTLMRNIASTSSRQRKQYSLVS